MSDDPNKEQKLLAARKKLKNYQKKRAVQIGSTNEYYSSQTMEVMESSSSRSSSVVDVTDYIPSNSSTKDPGQASEVPQDTGPNVCIDFDHLDKNNVNSLNSEGFSTTVPLVNNVQLPSSDNERGLGLENSGMAIDTEYYDSSQPSTYSMIQINMNPGIQSDLSEQVGLSCSQSNNLFPVESVLSHTSEANQQERVLNPIPVSELSLPYNQHSENQYSIRKDGVTHSEYSVSEKIEEQSVHLSSLVNKLTSESFEKDQLINELKQSVGKFEAQISQQGNRVFLAENSSKEQMADLNERLQTHSQTIAIVVSEKAQLQATLSSCQEALKDKEEENVSLRRKLEENGASLSAFKSSKESMTLQIRQLTQNNSDLMNRNQQLSNNVDRLKETCDGLKGDVSELSERLSVRSQEKARIDMELQEMKKKFELSQVYIEQLRNNSSGSSPEEAAPGSNATVEALREELKETKGALNVCAAEKDRVQERYKKYVAELSQERDRLKEQFSKKLEEESVLEEKIASLEALVASEAERRSSVEDSSEAIQKLTEDNESLTASVAEFKETNEQLRSRCDALTKDNGQLSLMLTDVTVRCESVEAEADRRNTEQVDTSQLVQSMQSDKVAASRALTQNKQLKEQLEELQSALVLMSNKKLEMTEKLETELHQKKFLLKQIGELSEELASHREKLSAVGKANSVNSNPAVISSKVAQENLEKFNKGEQDVVNHFNGGQAEHVQQIAKETLVDSRQIPEETIQVPMEVSKPSECDGQHQVVEETDTGVKILHEDGVGKNCGRGHGDGFSGGVGYVIDNEGSRLEMAHEALERRFLKAMHEVASLSDQKQHLEHLVQQLQLETDTVGDYITIYQFQRGVMKQQMQDLNFQLELLRTEKSDMALKLSQLQNLFRNLGLDSDAALFRNPSTPVVNGESKDSGCVNEGSVVQEAASVVAEEKATEETSPSPVGPLMKVSRSETVKKIKELISEMETVQNLDISALQNSNPCPHCSGALITV